MTTVSRLDAEQLRTVVDELAELLIDTVDGGASIGFLAPLDRAAAVAWWEERAAAVSAGRLAVWVAHGADRLLGTVSLAFPDKPNSRHRAELVKLMVHRDGRGRGLGRALLTTAEHGAAAAGVTLLHLDTETDSPAESSTVPRAGPGSGRYPTTRRRRPACCGRRRSSTSGWERRLSTHESRRPLLPATGPLQAR